MDQVGQFSKFSFLNIELIQALPFKQSSHFSNLGLIKITSFLELLAVPKIFLWGVGNNALLYLTLSMSSSWAPKINNFIKLLFWVGICPHLILGLESKSSLTSVQCLQARMDNSTLPQSEAVPEALLQSGIEIEVADCHLRYMSVEVVWVSVILCKSTG